MKITTQFRLAREDYLYLINRGFPTKSALDFVGNHYQLGKDERLLLFRGLRTTQAVLRMEHRLLEIPHAINFCLQQQPDTIPNDAITSKQCMHSSLSESQPGDSREANSWLDHSILSHPIKPYALFVIDGYNVLGTIMSYLLGRMLFISNDGIVRDIGAFHGKFSHEHALLEKAIALIAKTCSTYFPGCPFKIYLDEPVSQSAEHRRMLLSAFEDYSVDIEVAIIHSADFGLVHEYTGILCSSDSAILDATENLILDLPRLILERAFNAQIPHIDDL